MPKTPRPKTRRTIARSAIAQLGTQPWHMDPTAYGQLAQALESIARGAAPLPSAAAPALTLPVPGAEYSRRAQKVGTVAVIAVMGTLEPEVGFYTRYYGGSACSEIRSDLRNAAADTTVSQIALVIDSPGGRATGLEETAKLIRTIAQTKPVIAYCRNMAASGGYYLASACTRIYATPSTSVGSVGAMIPHEEYSKALEMMGITFTAIEYGKNKSDGHPYKPLSESARANIQAYVDSYGRQFVDHVASSRGLSAEQVMERFGQGQMFIAADALQRGMIDGVAMLEDHLTSSGLTVPDLPPMIAGSHIQQPKTNHTTTAPASMTGANLTTPSLTNAGQSPITNQSPTQESPKVNRLVALLYAQSFIATMTPAEGVVDAVVNAYCSARGVAVPRKENGELDAEACIAIFSGRSATATTPTTPANAEREEFTVQQYKSRRDDVRAIANLLNAGRPEPVVSNEMVDAAIDTSLSIAQIQAQWTKEIEASQSARSINTPAVGITGFSSGEDRFVTSATNALLARLNQPVTGEVPADMRSISLLQVGLQCAQYSGLRLGGTNEEIALALLQQNSGLTIMNSAGSFNRPGNFANILSNLANKILDNSMMMAGATFPRYANRMPDAPDFKPQTVLAIGAFDNLDEMRDGERSSQLRMVEEMKGWLQTGRFGNHAELTPVAMANDDLDAFSQSLMALAMAHDMTLNSLVLDLLVGNVTLADNTTLFNTSRANLATGSTPVVGAGGAPSATTASIMKRLHRKMVALGTSRAMNSEPNVVLVPAELEDAALQAYLSISELVRIAGGESKVANTDGTINVNRGRVEVVVEPGLTNYGGSTAAEWYSFDTRIRTLVYGYQTGYGQGGQRTTWFDNDTGSRKVRLEGRFGAAAVGWRGAVKNAGS